MIRHVAVIGLTLVVLQVIVASESQATSNKSIVFTSINNFSTAYYEQLANGNKKVNIALAPFSLWMLLYLLSNGATGRTKNEIQSLLLYDGNMGGTFRGIDDLIITSHTMSSSPGENNYEIQINIANMIFHDRHSAIDAAIEIQSFKNHLKTIKLVDFTDPEVTPFINANIALQTNDQVKNIMNPGDVKNTSRLVLASAMSLKVTCKKFDGDLKLKNPSFFFPNGTEKIIPFLTHYNALRHGELNDTSKFVVFPTEEKDSKIKMVIILPNPGSNLRWIESTLQHTPLSFFFDRPADNVLVYLPKMKFETRIDLQEPLEDLGMTTPFTNHARFDNFETLQNKHIKIDKIVQKTSIEISEINNESPLKSIISNRYMKVFLVNRPFIILACTGDNILLNVRIYDPTLENYFQ